MHNMTYGQSMIFIRKANICLVLSKRKKISYKKNQQSHRSFKLKITKIKNITVYKTIKSKFIVFMSNSYTCINIYVISVNENKTNIILKSKGPSLYSESQI